MGIEPKTAYEQLRAVAGTLIKKQWTRSSGLSIDGRKVTRYNWLSRMTYHDGEGWVEIEFTHHTAPHLLALPKHFTSYQLQQTSALRSVYSWWLLECVESWSNRGKWTATIEEFCHAMEAKASHRSNFGMLRRAVIEPAINFPAASSGVLLHRDSYASRLDSVLRRTLTDTPNIVYAASGGESDPKRLKELREKDGWLIDFEPVKAGRKVTALRFDFKRQPQGKLFDGLTANRC